MEDEHAYLCLPNAAWCCGELLPVVVVVLNIVNILRTNTKLFKTSVLARKYYGYWQFFMWGLSRVYFPCVLISGNFHGRGHIWSDRETD